MNEVVSIFVKARPGNSGSVSLEHLERLEVLFPDLMQVGRNGKELVLLNAHGEDDRIKHVFDELVRIGINIWNRDSESSGFGVSKQRLYVEGDLDNARYIHCCHAGKVFIGEMDYPRVTSPLGVPVLAGIPKQKARDFGTPEPPYWTCFVSRREAKRKLEEKGFVGLQLIPIEFNRAKNLQEEDKLWAVWSNLVLPPTKNIFQGDGGVVGIADALVQKYSSVHPAEGYVSQAELHFRREDLAAFGDFDVALMREPVKVQGAFTRNVIFSQRFRRFVIEELGVPFKGIPVRIDDDDLIPWEGPYPSKWAHLNRRPEWLEKLQEEVSGRGAK